MIHGEDPFRRGPGNVTARWKRQEGCCLGEGKYEQMIFQARSNRQDRGAGLPPVKNISTAARFGYAGSGFEGCPGNVGDNRG
jgi:hypothetical protein